MPCAADGLHLIDSQMNEAPREKESATKVLVVMIQMRKLGSQKERTIKLAREHYFKFVSAKRK